MLPTRLLVDHWQSNLALGDGPNGKLDQVPLIANAHHAAIACKQQLTCIDCIGYLLINVEVYAFQHGD